MQPLHTAVLNLHVGTVEALLRLGADPLATCPDCYPSLAAWKMRRGMQALQVCVAVMACTPSGCLSQHAGLVLVFGLLLIFHCLRLCLLPRHA